MIFKAFNGELKGECCHKIVGFIQVDTGKDRTDNRTLMWSPV